MLNDPSRMLAEVDRENGYGVLPPPSRSLSIRRYTDGKLRMVLVIGEQHYIASVPNDARKCLMAVVVLSKWAWLELVSFEDVRPMIRELLKGGK